MTKLHASLDRRFTVREEFCGYHKRRWVARFCGKWIGQSIDRNEAIAKALAFDLNRLSA